MRDTVDPASGTAAAAGQLIRALAQHTTCPPVRDVIGTNDVLTAYRVQKRVNAARISNGAQVVGRKIGLTSPAVQQQLGVDQPDFGILFDDMAHLGGETVPIARFLQPRVEAEVAFVLGNDLADGDLDVPQVRSAVDYAVAALEICDSRIIDWDISLVDTIADNASAGAFVLGPSRRQLSQFEPVTAQMTMRVSGQETSTGTGAACLGDPLLAVQWLARRAREEGEPLRAGQLVLSGALGPMRTITPGATVSATITGLGTVSCQFSKE